MSISVLTRRRGVPVLSWAVQLRQSVSLLVIVACTIFMLSTPASWPQHTLVGQTLSAIAFVLVVIAALGRVWCSVYISGYKEDRIVDVGPYAIVRNPLYAFSLLGAIGLGLATRRVSVLVLLVVAFLVYYPLVVFAEENKLLEKFGHIYEEYMRHTPRFWPRRFRPIEPDLYPTRPRHVRRALQEVLWFFWAYLLIELVVAGEGVQRIIDIF